MKESEQRIAAKRFVTEWNGRGDEKSDTQSFWLALLRDVYGVERPEGIIRFEQRVKLKNVSFIDAAIPMTHVLIEQKSADVDIARPIQQSDGSFLTPFQQAERYNNRLPYSQRNKWIIVCNFREFHIHDLETPDAPPTVVKLENLEKEFSLLNFMTDETQTETYRETQLSISAGELVGKLYDALMAQYLHPKNPESLRCLNVLCVRLVFCFYAEDAGILGKHNCVHNYLNKRRNADIRRALIELFTVLDTKPEDRDPYMESDLLEFPYVNGGLFHEKNIEIPRFTTALTDILSNDCSRDFDWSGISPTIFGAVFESTLNPETRRSSGMHYTSIENIHRVIDPLFLDDLRAELAKIFALSTLKTREERLKEFQRKLGALTFFDPACGSGNFLTETYISLRRLENDVLRALGKGQMFLSEDFSPVQVAIGQFYGIEINDFAVSVARTALWIAECQMLQETEVVIQKTLEFLPLRSYSNITEGNALRLDWEQIIPKDRLTYLMGNPPFVGKKEQTRTQKLELMEVFNKAKGVGKLDYVAAWYMKAVKFIQGTDIRCAFVSTNSITQGEQVPILWRILLSYNIEINFAWRTFKWVSESKEMAAVHCVIIGFSCKPTNRDKNIFHNDEIFTIANNINPYLVDAPNLLVDSRSTTLCDVSKMIYGSMPIDDGHLILNQEEVKALLAENSDNQRFIRRYGGGDELLHGTYRYCLWLRGVSPTDMLKSKFIMQHIRETEQFRRQSNRPQTRELANVPYLFGEIRQPETRMLVVPKVSSEKRNYIPAAFVESSTIINGSALIIPDAPLYYFGILISSVHMTWMRAVCGRLEMRYQYSGSVVYNNFPWPEVSSEVTDKITQTAQGILEARALYPDSSLADLYDELTMPPELRRAHAANDRAVLAAYAFRPKMTEPDLVAALMQRYQILSACVLEKTGEPGV